MNKRTQSKPDSFAGCAEAIELLRQSQWNFAPDKNQTIYELRVTLDTPGIFPPAKMDIPLPGLPTLDGFLSFVAFRAALKAAMRSRPDLAQMLLWQWNEAFRNPHAWIDFPLPLKEIEIGGIKIYDCSIGLPVLDGKAHIPAGTFFIKSDHAMAYDLKPFPDVVDTLPLRRRVVEPMGKRLALKSKLVTSQGKNKALNNRMYYALTKEYVFYFRGDQDGVTRLLNFAKDERIGIGKKTSLGYGQISTFTLAGKAALGTTLTYPLPEGGQRSTIKSLPYQQLLGQRQQGKANKNLLGCGDFRLGNALETVGAYSPPYWRKEHQTHILLYGSILIEYSS